MLDLLDIDDHAVPELKKLTKPAFDVESIINAAGELKYVSQLKRVLASQFSAPDDDFVRLLTTRVYDGVITQRVREQFAALTLKAMRQFLNDQANDRLKSAIIGVSSPPQPASMNTSDSDEGAQEDNDGKDKIVTSQEELDAFNVVRAIVRAEVDVRRVAARDTQSYFGVLLDDNNRKPICRLHFNRAQKYIGVFDASKTETRHPIDTIDDIFGLAEQLKTTVRGYEQP
ncbi:hypothetical protein D3C78_1284870 [compost metagenome]